MFSMGYIDGIVKTFSGMPGRAIKCQNWKKTVFINFFFLLDDYALFFQMKMCFPRPL